MANTKSAQKALRQNPRRRAMNLMHKRKTRDAIKQFKKLIAEGKIEEAKKTLSQVYKALDKTAKTGYIKKGRANRLKSRFTKKLTTR